MPDFLSNNLLSLVIFFPLVGAPLLLFFRRPADEEDHGHDHGDHGDHNAKPAANPAANAIRMFTLVWSGLALMLSLGLLARYDWKATPPGLAQSFQLVEGPRPWIEALKVNYHVGIDGVSLLLILLSTFLTFLCVLFSFNVGKRVKEYMIFLLVLETAMNGVFCALDMVLFYVFWEAVLIPMYFLIGIWGHERRIYAAIKFFLYTFAGSVLMLIGIVYLYSHTQSFSLVDMLNAGIPGDLAHPAHPAHVALGALDANALKFLFLAFALAFMIKVPMFPFHTWLPDAHVEAPTAGSVILAGVMLKMGTYGFLRFCLPLFPLQAKAFAPLFITLAVIGIVYGAVVATMQPDMKKLVAYSSVSHLGFVMLGIFSFTTLGITGAVLQSINHGVSTGMLFFLVGMLYDRRHTREIRAFGGLKRAVPILSTFFLIALLSSVALPLTNGFVGEFTILQGSYVSEYAGPYWTALSATGMVLSAVYMLWLFQRVFTGPIQHAENRHLRDLDLREKVVLVPLVVMVFWFGCYVTTYTRYLTAPVRELVSAVGVKDPTAAPADQIDTKVAVTGRLTP
jgi:NADH-quinone oxidoreductase subunit M